MEYHYVFDYLNKACLFNNSTSIILVQLYNFYIAQLYNLRRGYLLEFRLLLKESNFSPLVVLYIGVLYPPNSYVFSDCCSQQESKLQGLEGEMSQADREEQRLVRLINAQQVKLGQLTRDEEQNVERTEQRNRALNELCEQLTLTCKGLTVELLSDFDELVCHDSSECEITNCLSC